jgi:NAD(P)-dependent dehydrogenase (short-subunit alcohol dehydrogenase family)
MAEEFIEKVVLVTGGASGIGRATVEAFAREGAEVIIADFNRETSDAAVKAVTARGGKVTYQYCDVREPKSVDELFDFIRRKFGKLHCAVNDAGIDPEVRADTTLDLATFDAIHATNLRGLFLCLRGEVGVMSPTGGTIVNLGSFASLAGISNKPAYVTSKHGVLGLTRAAALQFIKQNIRINAVCPGPVKTPMLQANLDVLPKDTPQISMVPAGRPAEPSELADIILWLSSPRSSYVVGQAVSADGGLTA